MCGWLTLKPFKKYLINLKNYYIIYLKIKEKINAGMMELAYMTDSKSVFYGFDSHFLYSKQVSYNGYYKSLPRIRCEFNSHYLL